MRNINFPHYTEPRQPFLPFPQKKGNSTVAELDGKVSCGCPSVMIVVLLFTMATLLFFISINLASIVISAFQPYCFIYEQYPVKAVNLVTECCRENNEQIIFCSTCQDT